MSDLEVDTPDWVEDALGRASPEAVLEAEAVEGPGVAADCVPFRPWDAMAFARRYCASRCPCGEDFDHYGGDCTHFMAHVLKAGGITIRDKAGNNLCPDGLTIWAPDLMDRMEWAARTFANVRIIPPHALQAGDFGVFRKEGQAWHATMLASALHPPLQAGSFHRAYTLQHSPYRCATELVAGPFVSGRWYRIG